MLRQGRWQRRMTRHEFSLNCRKRMAVIAKDWGRVKAKLRQPCQRPASCCRCATNFPRNHQLADETMFSGPVDVPSEYRCRGLVHETCHSVMVL